MLIAADHRDYKVIAPQVRDELLEVFETRGADLNAILVLEQTMGGERYRLTLALPLVDRAENRMRMAVPEE
jgi:hypothetical protein